MRVGPRSSTSSDGQVLAMFTLFAPLLLAFVALGLDAAQVFLARRDAQGAADLAALSAAKFLPGDPAGARSQADSIGVANGYTAAEVTPVTPFDGDAGRIEVMVTRDVSTFFMPILDFFLPGDNDTMTVSARAVAEYEAASGGSGDFALWSLEPCGAKEDFSSINWSGNVNPVIGSVHSSSGVYISGNGQTISGDFSLECTAKGTIPAGVTDKFPYNETGDNPALTNGGGAGGLVPAACTGSEAVGQICRQDLAPPPIPSFASLLTHCDYIVNGTDVDFTSLSGPWSAPGGKLYAGVYCSNGKINLSKSDLAIEIEPIFGRQGITLLGNEIVMSGNNSVLAPHLDGILMYANTTVEGKGIDYAANGGRLEGILYSPNPLSKVKFAGNLNVLEGALIGYRVEYSGERNQLIGTFNPYPAGTPTLALIE